MLTDETMRRLVIAYENGPIVSRDFKADAKRIVLVARLIDKWLNEGNTNFMLMVNHVRIIENVFGETGMFAVYEYISNFPNCVPSLASILYYMGKIGKPAIYDTDLYDILTEI